MQDVKTFVFLNASGESELASWQARDEDIELTEENIIECDAGSVRDAINLACCKLARQDVLVVGSILDLADNDDLEDLQETLRFFAGRDVVISSYCDGKYPAAVFVHMVKFGRMLLERFSTKGE